MNQNKLKIFFLIFLLPTFFLFARTNVPLEKDYLDSFASNPPKINPTPLYKKGIEMLYISSKYKTEEIKSSDGKKMFFKMPDYPKALDVFLRSFKEEKNLASVFMAVKVIEFMGKKDLKTQILYLELIDILANNNNCKGLERKGAFYYYGKGGVSQNKKAGLSILKKASEICSKTYFINSIDNILRKEKK